MMILSFTILWFKTLQDIAKVCIIELKNSARLTLFHKNNDEATC